METDRLGTSRRAKQSMLRAVYEDNRRIATPGAVAAQRRRRAAGGVGLLLVLAAAAVVTVDRMGAPPVAAIETGPRTIFGANLPVAALVGDTADTWMPTEELRALANGSRPLTELFDLQVRTIVLDPGHGGDDPGTIGSKGTYEKDIALDVALRLRRRLLERGYSVLMTRTSDSTLSLRERVEFTNEQPTDLFVSIHVNAIPGDGNNVIETYYFGASADPRPTRVAEMENQGADYSVADFNDMIQRLGTTIKLQESRRLATAIQRSMVTNTRRTHQTVDSWGVKSAPFVVLLGAEAPSVLAEIAVLSNSDAETRLRDGAHRESLAVYLEEGILQYLIHRTQRASG